MRKPAMLISIATAALLAGAGFAASQGVSPGGPAGQPPSVAPPPAAAPAERSPETQSPGATQEPGAPKRTPRAQQPDQKAPRGAQREPGATPGQPPAGQAQTPRPGAPSQAQQPRDTAPGAPATTQREQKQPGATATLTVEQRTRIRAAVIGKSDAPRAANVRFPVRVGIAVPSSVRLVVVPETIVEIRPAWRGYLYFVVGDEVVVVHPRTLKIVAVIPA